MKFTIIFFVTILIIPLISSSKILGVFPAPIKSHFSIGEVILKTLAKAGHEVTMLSPFPQKKPVTNYTDYDLTGILAKGEAKASRYNIAEAAKLPKPLLIFALFWIGGQIIDIFEIENVKKLMTEEKFDLIITEIFCTEAFLGFGEHFNAPQIIVSPFGTNLWINNIVGNPSPLSHVPHISLELTDKMTFMERFSNTLMIFYESLLLPLLHYPIQTYVYNTGFPKATKSFSEMLRTSVSLVFLNSHISVGFPKPYLPNIIEIGGIHIEGETKPLPEDIKNFLDSATHGAIYFSMGSMLKSTNFTTKHRKVFVQVFSKVKQKIIWKFEDNDLNMPKNVLIKNWMPQNDILAHPNVIGFISHGGILGTMEAIHHGVPIIGIPLYGDQDMNMKRAEANGYGLKLSYGNISVTSVSWMLNEVINNSRYRNKMKEVSSIFRDRSLSPKESVKYWVDYVIRHKGAPHLRSAGADLSFIQYHNIDIFLLIGISTIMIIKIKNVRRIIYGWNWKVKNIILVCLLVYFYNVIVCEIWKTLHFLSENFL